MLSRPCMASTSRREMTRPRPEPSMLEVSRPRRSKGWNSRPICSPVMPAPESEMQTTMRPSPPGRTDQQTRPAGRLYLTAFEPMLSSTWRSRWGSARTCSVASVTSQRWLTARASASGPSIARQSSISGTRASARGCRPSSSASMRCRSSTSLTRVSRWRPALRMWSTWSMRAPARSRSSCAKPMIALSGVRISWLMRDMNAVLLRLASSATSLSWRACSACWRSLRSRTR